MHQGTPKSFALDPGEYRFVVEADGIGRREFHRTIEEGRTLELDIALRSANHDDMSSVAAGSHKVEFVVGVAASGEARWFRKDFESPPFAIDRRSVTNAEWEEFLRATRPALAEDWLKNTSIARRERDSDWGELPVTRVSWTIAREYAEWRGKRLPTLVEWERAMGADATTWLTAEIEKGLANFNLDRPEFAAWRGRPRSSMGAYVRYVQPANQDARGFGPHRMQHPIGNVKEWVASTSLELDDDGRIRPLTRRRLSKGAAWHYPRKLVTASIFSRVLMKEARDSSADVGFRCARTIS